MTLRPTAFSPRQAAAIAGAAYLITFAGCVVLNAALYELLAPVRAFPRPEVPECA